MLSEMGEQRSGVGLLGQFVIEAVAQRDDLAVQIRVFFHQISDAVVAVENGGMISSAKQIADLWIGRVRFLSQQEHSDLTGPRDGVGATGSPKVADFNAVVASYFADDLARSQA